MSSLSIAKRLFRSKTTCSVKLLLGSVSALLPLTQNDLRLLVGDDLVDEEEEEGDEEEDEDEEDDKKYDAVYRQGSGMAAIF